MALTDRQTTLYTDTVTIYKPTKPSGLTAEGFDKDTTYTSVATGVACKFFRRGETSELTGVGRLPKITDYQLDRFHLDVSQELDDGYVMVITNSSSPYNGYAWYVDGVPTRRQTSGRRRPNYCMAFVKHIFPKPSGVS